MKKNCEKKLLALLLALALCLTLAACGGSGGSGGGDSSGSGGNDGGGSGGSDDSNVITIMINAAESDAVLTAEREIIQRFNETNDLGVTIEMQNVSNADYKTKLSTLMASNSVPDIFFTWELGYLENWVNGGKVLSLQEYLDADSEWTDSFSPGVLDSYAYGGESYAIPMCESVALMYYNTDIFEQYNLSVPTTYDEFIDICDTLVANDVIPLALAGSSTDAWLSSQYIQQMSNGIAGYSVYEGLVNGTGAWNDPSFVEASKLFQEQIDAGYFEPGFTGVGVDEAQQMFQNGQTAMYFNGSWVIATLDAEDLSSAAGHMGCFQMPAVNSQYAGVNMGAGDRAYAISASTSNPEACVAYLKFLTSPEIQEFLVYDYGKFPSIKMDVDATRCTPLFAEAVEHLNNSTALTAWMDRVDTDMGNEFNNQGVSIANGSDAQDTFDYLQEYYELNYG